MAALKKKEAGPAAPPDPSEEVDLLSEIRERLENRKLSSNLRKF